MEKKKILVDFTNDIKIDIEIENSKTKQNNNEILKEVETPEKIELKKIWTK